jgi:hypothetical protein
MEHPSQFNENKPPLRTRRGLPQLHVDTGRPPQPVVPSGGVVVESGTPLAEKGDKQYSDCCQS